MVCQPNQTMNGAALALIVLLVCAPHLSTSTRLSSTATKAAASQSSGRPVASAETSPAHHPAVAGQGSGGAQESSSGH